MTPAVRTDDVRGHISLGVGDDPASVVMTDMGDDSLHLWAFTSATLTPETALALARALEAWVAKRAPWVLDT